MSLFREIFGLNKEQSSEEKLSEEKVDGYTEVKISKQATEELGI